MIFLMLSALPRPIHHSPPVACSSQGLSHATDLIPGRKQTLLPLENSSHTLFKVGGLKHTEGMSCMAAVCEVTCGGGGHSHTLRNWRGPNRMFPATL